MKNIPEYIKSKMDKVDPERLEGYMKMFDRILLYNVAANLMPPDAIQEMLNFWEKTVKKTIDIDCSKFTDILQSTEHGRLQSMIPEHPDGEDMRLKFLDTFDLAHEIVSSNLTKHDDGPFDDDSNGLKDFDPAD